MWSLWCTGVGGLGGKHDSTFSRSVKIGAHETTWCTFSLDKDSAKTFCARPHLKKYCWNPFVSFDTPKITCGIVLWSTLCISVHSVHICAYHIIMSCKRVKEKTRKSAKNWIGWIEILNLAKKIVVQGLFLCTAAAAAFEREHQFAWQLKSNSGQSYTTLFCKYLE